ncbi:MAG: GNAT family N-acetyltransferase [Anaerolineae bacterium]|nr:GNAT family N-acetyltransferase [Anaerolineae bacterium]
MEHWEGPRLVKREELLAAHRLAALCFPEDLLEAPEEELLAAYKPPRKGGLYVICHNGSPVSELGVYHSRLSLYGSYIRIASIGGVCTHPDYRGQGLATRLLEHAIRALTEEGAHLLLISGIRDLYERAGCVTAGVFEYFTLKPDQLPAQEERFTVRPATPDDAPLCARLYHQEAVHFERPVEDFVHHFRRAEEYLRAEDWIIETNGRPQAYLFTGLPWEALFLQDHTVREVREYAGSRLALVAGLGILISRLGLRELRFLVPWQEVDLIQMLRGYGVASAAIPLLEHTMRVVNLPGLMTGLNAYIAARLTEKLRRGLRFEQNGERYVLVRGRERLALDGKAMTRLIMGVPPEMATGVDTGQGTLAEIVAALFPLPSFLPGLNYR